MNNKEVIKVLQKRLNENAYYNRLTARKITSPYFKHNVLKYRLALLYAIKAVRDADNAADVLYICDHEACKRGITYGADACDPCGHTRNIRHAANFEPLIDNDGRILAYVEHAQTDEDECTNPQGDLISRETLQEKHSKECIHNCYYCKHYKWSSKHTHGYCDVIDNAPTVEPFEPDYVGAERLKARQRGYEDGYHNGMKIGKTLNPKIKQGEWIDYSDTDGFIECPFCHSATTCEDNIDELHYCWCCGAELKKGGVK